MAEADHHVKFSTDTHLEPDPVHVEEIGGGKYEAHLGMLRNHHTYSADIPVPHTLGASISASHALHNIHVTVIEAPVTKPRGDGSTKFVSSLKIQVKTVKEGEITEKIRIYNDEDTSAGEMEIIVTAKVLKTNQGNPLLKTGIHVVSHQHADESDFTEWPGFSKSKMEDEDD